MKARDIFDEVVHVSAETLDILAYTFIRPWRANKYCVSCGLPPLRLRTDWAYRRVLLEDTRDDDERLAGLLPPSLQPASDGLGDMARSVADRLTWQAEHAPDRRWIWWTNLTTVHFSGGAHPLVFHRTHTFPLADPHAPARPYVVAVATLDVPATELMPVVPPPEAT